MDTRKKYPKEFKLDAVSLVLDQSYTRIKAAKSRGINSTMLGRWVKEHQRSSDGQVSCGNGKLTPEQIEIRQLREENRRLKMEKDI
jgi:transposase